VHTGEQLSYVITAAPPNPNGDLHLGHLSGPFLGADVLRRSLVQQGHQARYVSYSDDYSCYVRRKALQLGQSTERTAYVYGRRMEETLALGQMLPDRFTHPQSEPLHTQLTQRFFLELWNSGALETRELPAFFCDPCQQYLYEAEVTGTCPHCQASSGGLECEECGRRLATTGLLDPQCITCGATPRITSLRRIVFPIERHREGMTRFVANGNWRPRLAEFLNSMLAEPLPEVPVSRLDPLGIPVPLPGWEGHILDTWFGGVWGYLAAATAHATIAGETATGEQLWKDPDTEVIHFLGFDCSFSHAVFWPALLLAHGDLRLPGHIITNEFYRLEGGKFSTSRGHAIWGGEFLRLQPADAVRFFLCLTGPEDSQTNFSSREYTRTTDEVLLGGLRTWTDDLISLVHNEFAGTVPAGSTESADPRVAGAQALPDVVAAALAPASFSMRRAAEALRDTALAMPDSLAAARALGTGTQRAQAVADQLEALARFAAAAAPLMPAWSSQVSAALGLPETDPLSKTPPWPRDGRRMMIEGRPVAPSCPTPLWRFG
jgi:methionyl-tRNA synthetase